MKTQEPKDDEITLFCESNRKSASAVTVVVCIPTFRRPDHLALTLDSVLQQDTRATIAVVVMDNHPEQAAGAETAQHILAQSSVPSTVILAHRRGNCAAYNAGFHTALAQYPKARWVQVIDDDEIAPADWLDQQIAVAESTGADFIGAPQHPVFEAGGDPKWCNHPVFMPPYKASGPVPILYSSGNVLITTQRLRDHHHPWLDEVFNFLGGGDSDFYSRCKEQGATFAWCSNAGVHETTPARRTELSWLNSRSLRNGSISTLIQKRSACSWGNHLGRLVKTCLLLAASPYRSLTLFVKQRSLIMALNPMNVALGRVLMEFGFANEQYRAADKN